MKSSNEYIRESVFGVNLKYTEMQNKTKELFFKCLDEGQSLEYFKVELDKLWGNLDRSFMEKELAEYEALIHEKNIAAMEIQTDTPKEETEWFFTLVAASVILAVEKKFKKQVERDYTRTLKSPVYKENKTEYLSLKVNRYKDEKIVPYHYKDGKIRYVSMAQYAAMIHNTNMTYTGWNATLNDAKYLDYATFYIPYHSFSCPHCITHQEKQLTSDDVMNIVGDVKEQKGDILHPNCKCELLIYDYADKTKSKLTDEEKSEIYHIRQKANTLTLEKTRIATDMKIQKGLGNMSEYDTLNQKRNKVNAQIRELKDSLPTKELKKQVVAINR